MRVASSSIRLSALRRPGLVGEAAPAEQLGVAADGGERACAARARRRPRTGAAAPRSADFSAKAPSIWASISLRADAQSARPRCPAGPRARGGSGRPRRWRRPCPPSGAAGRRPRRTTTRTSTPMASSTARLAMSSTLRSESSVSLVGLSENDGDQGPLGDGHGDRPVLRRRGRRCCRGRRRRGRGGTCRRSARPGPGGRCRAPAAPGCPWSGSAPGRAGPATPTGRRRITCAAAVEQRDVDVGRDAAREVGLGDRQRARPAAKVR